ncbi:MAG TPA: hypothetical protein VFM54_15900 [Micromonosporaceae bacterium]|nr:hypothetical protein [Micromonosporaceae bacterium]
MSRPCGDALVDRWTGRHATALQAALRESQDEFAARLGVAKRTIASWHERPDVVIRPELQRALDTAYERASEPAKLRFARRLKADDTAEINAAGGAVGSTQHVGQDWGDDGVVREDRELKHRAKAATRDVPAPPPLVRALRWHVAAGWHGSDGRLFVAKGWRTGPVSLETYTRVWRQARKAALTPVQQRSPLARRPYDLRHAAVSLWLNAGVPAPQVAEWAGHSVAVLLKVYAKCIDGQDQAAKKRIETALAAATEDEEISES